MTRRAGVYARISKADRSVPKVENQIDIARGIAEDEGWTLDPAHIFSDDGIAASGRAIDDTTLENRPGALAALEAIRAGAFDVLIAVEGERLARTYLDGLRWIEASTVGGVTWHLDTDGALDPSTPAGEETAVGIFASGRREGRVRNARQKRRYDRDAAQGIPKRGSRPFGYEVDGITLRESEARLIRDAVADVLDGSASMLAIAQRWNAAGVVTDGMKRERRGRDGTVRPPRQRWTASTVKQLLGRPRNAGILVHRGEVMPKSQIQPIITREQHEALTARSVVRGKQGRPGSSLLGGTLRCSCGEPMHSTISYSQKKGGPRREYRVYKCAATIYDKTQPHASVQEPIADGVAVVELARVLARTGLDAPASANTVRIRDIEARLVELAGQEERAEEALVEGLGDPRRVKGRLRAIKTERDTLSEERENLTADRASEDVMAALRDVLRARIAFSRATHPSAMLRMTWAEVEAAALPLLESGDHWAEVFGSLPIETQRQIVRTKLTAVCHPAKTHGRGTKRIEIRGR